METKPIALVTGGASGIGWAIARRFAASGAIVGIADLDAAKARARTEEFGSSHFYHVVDIGDPAAAARMVRQCHERFGRLDVLVNNAGRTNNTGLNLAEQSRQSFDEIVGINTEGSLAVARAAAELMAMAGGGSIVNIASGAAFRALPFRSAYSASKAAILSMSRQLAIDWAPRNVRVNVVAPGFVHTELLQDLIASGRLDPSHALARIPLGRMGTPDEIAAAVEFLASGSARCISGAALNVDGGATAFGGSGSAVRQAGAAPIQPPAGRRVAILFGAANDIGEAVAARLSDDGMIVALVDRDRDRMTRFCEQLGDNCASFVDTGEDDAVAELSSHVKARFGRIDAVVNLRPEAFQSEARETIRARLGRVHRLIRSVGPILLAQGYGTFLNLTCGLTSAQDDAHSDEVVATETAVEMLSRTLACEWGGSGINANTLALEACSSLRPHGVYVPGGCIGLPRAGDLEDIAHAVRFLISDDVRFINAAMLTLNCGAEAFRERRAR